MQCKAKTKTGARCNGQAVRNSDLCFSHAPQLGAKRAQARKRGGATHRTPHAANPAGLPAEVKTLADAQKILAYTLGEVLPMPNSIQRARVLIALFDSFVKSIEAGQFEQRLAALEAMKQ